MAKKLTRLYQALPRMWRNWNPCTSAKLLHQCSTKLHNQSGKQFDSILKNYILSTLEHILLLGIYSR